MDRSNVNKLNEWHFTNKLSMLYDNYKMGNMMRSLSVYIHDWILIKAQQKV